MIRLLALVEGPTERNFCQQVLAPHLGHHGVALSPKVIGKPGHKGGCRWEIAKREILALLKQGSVLCTTMFDLYALPDDWPGRGEARRKGLKKIGAAREIELAKRIGLKTMREKCPHFNEWLTRMELLGKA